jgi:hypothetical protein
MRSSKQERIQEYLKTKVSHIFERMMVELLAQQPENVVDWSVQWLNTKGTKPFERVGRELEGKRSHSAMPAIGITMNVKHPHLG